MAEYTFEAKNEEGNIKKVTVSAKGKGHAWARAVMQAGPGWTVKKNYRKQGNNKNGRNHPRMRSSRSTQSFYSHQTSTWRY